MKVHQASSWNLPPTPKQVQAITRLCVRKGIKEPLENSVSNRYEARALINELRRD